MSRGGAFRHCGICCIGCFGECLQIGWVILTSSKIRFLRINGSSCDSLFMLMVSQLVIFH